MIVKKPLLVKLSIILLFIFLLTQPNIVSANTSNANLKQDEVSLPVNWELVSMNFINTNNSDISIFNIGDSLSYLRIFGELKKDGVLNRGTFSVIDTDKIIATSDNIVNLSYTTFFPKETIYLTINLDNYVKQEKTVKTNDIIDNNFAANVNKVILSKGTSFTLLPTEGEESFIYSWSIENPKIASINATSGKVKAIKDGSTRAICEIIFNNQIHKIYVDVVVGSLDGEQYFNKTNLSLGLKESFDLNMSNKISGSSYLWQTDNKKIATVKSNGLVTAKKKGTTAISCTVTTPSNEIIIVKTNITVK